jgi:hypothetical protein
LALFRKTKSSVDESRFCAALGLAALSIWRAPRWIQDGNHEEFVVGRRYDFQVEAFPHSLEQSEFSAVPRCVVASMGAMSFPVRC